MNFTESVAHSEAIKQILQMKKDNWQPERLLQYMLDYIKYENILIDCHDFFVHLDTMMNRGISLDVAKYTFGEDGVLAGGFIYNHWLPEDTKNLSTDIDVYIPRNFRLRLNTSLDFGDALYTRLANRIDDFEQSAKSTNLLLNKEHIPVTIKQFDAKYATNPSILNVISLNNWPEKGINVQFIVSAFTTVEQIVEDFDFFHCASGYYNGKLYTSPLAFFTATNAILMSQNINHFRQKRFDKFINRKFTIWDVDKNYEKMIEELYAHNARKR